MDETPNDTPRLEMKAVSKRFPGVLALDRVDLSAWRGEVHGIVGENGAGKSTLMKVLSGVHTEYDGEISLDGNPVRFGGPRDAESAGIAIIHQELNVVPTLSVAENIFLGRELVTGPGLLRRREMEERSRKIFRELKTDIDPSLLVEDLRIGDQQLVEIAKALSLEADIVIMDEPTSALSDTEVEHLFHVIRSLREDGKTILYISHKMDEIFTITDRITVLRDGRGVAGYPTGEVTVDRVIADMVGRELTEHFPQHGGKRGNEILRVGNLALPDPDHPGRMQLEGISFSLHRGEILGIAGLMGAGRTELLEALFGSSPTPPAGTIEVDGKPVAIRSPDRAIDLGIAFITEDRKNLGLFLERPVVENITMVHLAGACRRGLIESTREEEIAQREIKRLSIRTPDLNVPVETLSGGNQQKVILGRWLAGTPRILLLDDPTRGVDVGAKAEIYRIMNGLVEEGIGIALVSSELPELLALSDRILVLCEGRVTGEFSREEATQEKIMAAATALHRNRLTETKA
jgi:ABC-type sugar transport system ATPase subunit